MAAQSVKVTGRGIARRLEQDGQIVGTLLETANGRWRLGDVNEKPITARTFPSPRAARDWFVGGRKLSERDEVINILATLDHHAPGMVAKLRSYIARLEGAGK